MTLGPEAFHGPAGQIAQAWGPHTEADPAGILVSLLVLAGNAMGFGPHVRIAARMSHRMTLQAILVGETATVRKSTAIGIARDIMERAADVGWKYRIQSTHTSAEAIVEAVADLTPDAETGKEAGSDDKRLVICAPEIATQFAAAMRPGSNIFQTLRLAWDGAPIGAVSRRSKLRAENHHISLLGACTPSELREVLPAAQALSGSTNRMLFVRLTRTRNLPFGSDMSPDDEGDCVNLMRRALLGASRVKTIGFAQDCRAMWVDQYEAIVSRNGHDPLAAYLAREDVQVVRIAGLYAALDGLDRISPVHLGAANALWASSAEAVRWVWGDPTQERGTGHIMRMVTDAGPEGVSLRDLYRTIGVTATQAQVGVEALEQSGLACSHLIRRNTRGPVPLMLFSRRFCPDPAEHRKAPPVEPTLTTDQKMRQALGR